MSVHTCIKPHARELYLYKITQVLSQGRLKHAKQVNALTRAHGLQFHVCLNEGLFTRVNMLMRACVLDHTLKYVRNCIRTHLCERRAVQIYKFIYMQSHTHLYYYSYRREYENMCINIYAHIYVYKHIYINTCMWVYRCAYTCMSIYIYIYMYIYIYTHI